MIIKRDKSFFLIMTFCEQHSIASFGDLVLVPDTQLYGDINSAIVLGTDYQERISNVVENLSIDMYFHLFDTSQDISNIIEFDLLYDKNPNGALPPNVYIHVGQCDTFLNEIYIDRFIPLFQCTLFTNRNSSDGVNTYGTNTSATINGEQLNTFTGSRFTVDLKRLKTTYQASNGNIGDISTGSLIVYAYSVEASHLYFAYKLYFI